MNEFDPENLGEPASKYETAGGPAIKPRGPSGAQKTTDKGKQIAVDYAKKGANAAAKAALIASGVGAGLAAVGGKAAEWLTEKVLNKGWWKALLLAQWPTFATMSIILGLMFLIAAPAFARIGASRRGVDGKRQPENIYAASSSDVAEVQEVLGNSITVPGDPTKWYWNQGDRNSDWRDVHLRGWSGDHDFAAVGCGLTSAAMIAKYYGVTGVSPRVFGELVVSQTGNAQSGWREELATYTNRNLVDVPENLASIKAEIAAGNPVLARGNKAFGSSDGHFVVIIGVSKNDRFLVLNDPSSSGRGRPARYSPASELGGSITGLWAYHAK